MKRTRGILALVMSFILLAGMASFASAQEADLSEKVELVMYFMGDQPADTQSVVDAINEKLEKDLNATLKIVNISWADWRSKYNLVLASGEKIDLIYTANWCQFVEQARKGAYMKLNDLLHEYAPISWANIDPARWESAEIDGSIYAIPATEKVYIPFGIEYRKDFCDQYGLPEVDSLETLEAYLDGVKENVPDITPFNIANPQSQLSEIMPLFRAEYKVWNAVQGDYYYLVTSSDQKDIADVQVITEMPEFAEFCKTMKRWNEKGFWSKSVLSNKITSYEQFAQGNSAAGTYRLISISTDFAKLKGLAAEAEPSFWCFGEYGNAPFPTSAQGNMTAVYYLSENPERALMLYELLKWDEAYNRLLIYGIEGKHYAIDEQGSRIDPEGVSSEMVASYSGETAGAWSFRNDAFKLVDTGLWSGVAAIEKRFEELNRYDKTDAFVFDKTAVETESAALDLVMQQYLGILLSGSADDVDAMIAEFHEKLLDAGLEKVKAEVVGQLTAYKESKGY